MGIPSTFHLMMSPLALYVLFGGYVKLIKKEKSDDSTNLAAGGECSGNSDNRSGNQSGLDKQ
jgi:hypothetical protein